ncbi:hypothetical protein [Persephonella sp.]
MDFWKIYRNSQKLFLYERSTGKVSFNMQLIPADSYRFINSILKVNIDLMEIIAEGWQKISSKFSIYPVHLAGIWSNKYLMFENRENIAVARTPEKLEILHRQIRSMPITELILLDYVEAAGVISMETGEYDIKGDLNEEEIRLINSIVHAFDDLSVLITDMLLYTSGLAWDKNEGWFLAGDGHVLISVLGKWCFMDAGKFEDVLLDRG